VLRFFQFVDEGDGVVLHGDFAVALGIADELVFAEAEFSGARESSSVRIRLPACPVAP
jgi:hypothetical protein